MTLPEYVPNPESTELEKLTGLIDFLSAYIEQFHNGFVRLLSYEDGKLVVELGGRCESCALSTTTLHGWVEGTTRQFFPEIKEVVGIAASTGEPVGV